MISLENTTHIWSGEGVYWVKFHRRNDKKTIIQAYYIGNLRKIKHKKILYFPLGKSRGNEFFLGIFHFRPIMTRDLFINIITMKNSRFSPLILGGDKGGNQGFTLIEVLIASLILSSVLFAILSMISGNSRQTVNLNASSTMDELFLSSKACIQSFGYTYLSGMTATQSLNFGTENFDCFTGSYDPNLSFTGITLARDTGTWTETETGYLTFWNYFSQTGSENGVIITDYLTDGKDMKKYEFIVTP